MDTKTNLIACNVFSLLQMSISSFSLSSYPPVFCKGLALILTTLNLLSMFLISSVFTILMVLQHRFLSIPHESSSVYIYPLITLSSFKKGIEPFYLVSQGDGLRVLCGVVLFVFFLSASLVLTVIQMTSKSILLILSSVLSSIPVFPAIS